MKHRQGGCEYSKIGYRTNPHFQIVEVVQLTKMWQNQQRIEHTLENTRCGLRDHSIVFQLLVDSTIIGINYLTPYIHIYGRFSFVPLP